MANQKDKEMITNFTEGPVSRQLILFAAPLFLSNLLQVVYNMVDMVVVGHAVGKAGLSAVSVGGDLTSFLTFLSMGFSMAGQVIISQYIGANQRDKTGRFIGTMFTFLLSCAAVLSLVCLLLRVPILSQMNTPEASWDQALDYSTVTMAGLVFVYGYNMVSAALRGMGDSKHPFIFISIAAIMNVILDLVFVLGLGMESMGAALATVMSQGFSFLCCLVFLWKRRVQLGFSVTLRDFFIQKDMLKDLLKLGVPMAIKSGSIHFSKLFVNSWINAYGVEVSAMAGIAKKFSSISNLISNSSNTAGASMIGQNIGAQQYARVPKIMKTTFKITLTASSVLALIILLFPAQVFGIFTNETAVLRIAMEYRPVAFLVFFGSACRAPMNALINGSGNYKINFITAVLDGLVLRIGLAMLFGLVLHLEYVGFWLGDALAGYTPFFIGAVYFYTGRWKSGGHIIKRESA